MILPTHIIIALASVAWASITLFRPTHKKFIASYGLILATIASGTVLIVVDASAMLHACVSGLIYVTVISIVTIATQVKLRKLQPAKVRIEK